MSRSLTPSRDVLQKALRSRPRANYRAVHRTFAVSQRRPEENAPARWAQAPPRTKAPVTLRKRDPRNEYPVNESVEKLDEVLEGVLGQGGSRLLTEEVKWLAVTHKSFDQGRRGYNDRLAFIGKRIMDLESSTAILSSPSATPRLPPDPHAREPFKHSALDTLPKLASDKRDNATDNRVVARMADSLGLLSVLRWKPRMAYDLQASGVDAALSSCLYALVGAVALQNGGDVAARLVRDRLLKHLGLS